MEVPWEADFTHIYVPSNLVQQGFQVVFVQQPLVRYVKGHEQNDSGNRAPLQRRMKDFILSPNHRFSLTTGLDQEFGLQSGSKS